MDISKYLAKVMGLYFLIVSVGMLTHMQPFTDSVNALIQNAPLMFLSGFFTIILGLLLVVGHNIWERSWRVLVTLIAWIVLIKGSMILFCPEYMSKISLQLINNTTILYVSIGIDFMLGLLLTYCGFRR